MDRALELEADARRAFLAGIARERPDLAATLQRLLDEHDRLLGSDFLDRSPATIGQPAASLAGQTLGAYTLEAPLGMGGMGTVWRARRSDGRFEGFVAVKLLNLALVGPRGDERFRREGTMLARLTHPNVARLIDAGVTPAGQPYLVLEYIEGSPIDTFADERRLPLGERLRLFLQVAEAVAHAHANLIVHRDLKPSNVLVRPDRQVKLLDFGIGKLLEPDEQSHAALTRDGGRALTPEFAAPEQIAGEPVTTATDVYALGVLLYVLLTGRHPAVSARDSAADIVRAIVEVDPLRASQAVVHSAPATAAARASSPDRLKRSLRGDLDTILAKALKKRPSERYATVTALAEDVRRHLTHQPITARPDTLSYRAARFVRRNRAAVALSALAAVALAGGVTATLVQARTARAQRDFALRQLARAENLNDLNDLLLYEAAPLGKPFTVNDLLARAEHIASRQRDHRDPTHIDTLISVGRLYWAADQDAIAVRVLNDAYIKSRHIDDPSSRGRASCALAGGLSRRDVETAETLAQQGLNELGTGPEFVVDRIFCLLRGSEVSREAGRPADAIAKLGTARRLLSESPYKSDLVEISILTNLAVAYNAAGDNANAIPVFAEADSRLAALGRDGTQKAGTLYNNWALSLFQIGRPLDAEVLFRRAIDIARHDASEENVSPMLLLNYARTLRDLDHIDAATDYAARAYAKAEQADDQVVMNQALLERNRIYRVRGDLSQAASMLDAVMPRLTRSLPSGHPAFAALVSEQALLADAGGDFTRALPLADQAVNMADAAFTTHGTGVDFLAVALLRRAGTRLRAGRPADAAVDAARARDLLQRGVAADTRFSTLGRAHLALALALQAQSRHAEASDSARVAVEHLESALGADHPETRTARQLAANPK
jgi:eukaryotic-like serine/threonine-protein kinase